MKGNGLIRKFRTAFTSEDETKIAKEVYDAVESKTAKKAEFALDMIFSKDPEKIKNPDLHMGPENEIIIPVLEMEWYEWETEVSPGGKRLGTA